GTGIEVRSRDQEDRVTGVAGDSGRAGERVCELACRDAQGRTGAVERGVGAARGGGSRGDRQTSGRGYCQRTRDASPSDLHRPQSTSGTAVVKQSVGTRQPALGLQSYTPVGCCSSIAWEAPR